MGQKAIICLVIVAIVAIAVYFVVTTKKDAYCNCTGMATKYFKAPYTFWEGAGGWKSNYGMPFVEQYSSAFPQAYKINEDVIRDHLRDQRDGLIDTSVNEQPSKQMTGPSQMANEIARRIEMENELKNIEGTRYGPRRDGNFVKLSTIGASLPPGAVTNAKPYMATKLRFGDGEYLDQAPSGLSRYGGFGTTPQDLSVGVL